MMGTPGPAFIPEEQSAMSTRSLHAMSLALTIGLTLTPGLVLAQPAGESKPFEMTETLVRWMFAIGIIAISAAWVAVTAVFAWKNSLNQLLNILMRGPLIKFVTVTYIIVVIVTLSLVGQLESSHVSTLLGAIAGYVLGDRGREEKSAPDSPASQQARVEHPASQGNAPGARPLPPTPQHASEQPQSPSEFHL
jgi:hypothetical protein